MFGLSGFGIAHSLREMLAYKSDLIRSRQKLLGVTIIREIIHNPEDALELNYFLISAKRIVIILRLQI